MSMERNVPISMEPSRPLYHFENDPFFRDPAFASFREAFRDPMVMRDPLVRDPMMVRDQYREPMSPTYSLREVVRDPYREVAVHHPTISALPMTTALPLTRSFFNPERQLSAMDGEMSRMAAEMKRMFSEMQHLMPVDANPESWRKKENYLLDNPVYHDQSSGNPKFRLQFDVRQFKPEEIFVKTLGNELTVHAKHEEKGEGKSVFREYHRQYVLPKELSPESLVSKLSREGTLTIEAPLPIKDSHREKLIPIEHK